MKKTLVLKKKSTGKKIALSKEMGNPKLPKGKLRLKGGAYA